MQAVIDHAEGLVCLTGCAQHPRSARRQDEPHPRRLLDGFGPENLYVELQRPFAATTGPATAR